MAQDYTISNFLGGINESVDEFILKQNEAKTALNCNIDRGILESCKGYSLFQTCPVNPTTLMTYYKNNIGYLIVAGAGKLYKLDGTTWTQIGSGFKSDDWDYINYNYNSNDVIIMTNGTDNVKLYDGTTLRDLKNRRKVYNDDGTIKNYVDGNGKTVSSESAVTTLAPKGKFIDLHYERIWIADDNNLYFSTADVHGFDIEDWTVPVNQEDTNQHGGQISAYTNDGSKIIGLKVIFDDIVYFKDKSIFKIFGAYPGNYQKVQLFSSNGAIADKSIVTSNKGAFFINKDGIYIYDGTNVTLLSQKITPTFSTLNRSLLNKSCAVFYANKYILAVPKSVNNDFIIEYNIDEKNFMYKSGFIVESFAEINNDLLFTSDKVYKYNDGTTFGGLSINVSYETGLTDMGMPDVNKEIDSIYFTASGSGSITITAVTENKAVSKAVTLSANNKTYNINISNYGRLIGFKFVSSNQFKLKGFKVLLDLDED